MIIRMIKEIKENMQKKSMRFNRIWINSKWNLWEDKEVIKWAQREYKQLSEFKEDIQINSREYNTIHRKFEKKKKKTKSVLWK
jgi:hypothetical protein